MFSLQDSDSAQGCPASTACVHEHDGVTRPTPAASPLTPDRGGHVRPVPLDPCGVSLPPPPGVVRSRGYVEYFLPLGAGLPPPVPPRDHRPSVAPSLPAATRLDRARAKSGPRTACITRGNLFTTALEPPVRGSLRTHTLVRRCSGVGNPENPSPLPSPPPRLPPSPPPSPPDFLNRSMPIAKPDASLTAPRLQLLSLRCNFYPSPPLRGTNTRCSRSPRSSCGQPRNVAS